MANDSLWAGLLQGFAQARDAKLARQASEEEKKLKIKLFKQQLEDQDKQKAALDQLQGLMSGVGQDVGPAQQKSILDILADPEGQGLLLQSGMKLQDILDIQQRGEVNKILSGQGTSGMELEGIKFDTSGRPMLDFSRPKVEKWVPSSSGMEMVGLDQGGKPITTRPMAPGEKPQPTEEEKRQRDLTSALDVYEKAKQGLLKGLGGTVTGPLIGALPPITSEQQTAQGSVAAMAPVLKQLFRAAGEGVFTDRDQQLLLEMIPTRETNPEARAAMIQNIDAIVRAKLGMGENAPSVSGGLSPEDEALVNKYLK